MNEIEDIAIVGAALAGATAAKALRDEGYEGRLRLFGAERHAPYIRPPLSKGYLAGTEERASIDVFPASWYSDNAVELHLDTRIAEIDPAGTVTTEHGARHRFDRALLATGSVPRRLPIPGAELPGVLSLRTVDDSDLLRETLKGGGRRIVLIGSGWIGMEVAATARTLGNDVTILERDPVPLAAALGDELGDFFADAHRQRGVRIRTSVGVEAITEVDGRAAGVRLAEGEIVPADLVLVGVGALPLVELAERAGLETGDGVLTDSSLRTSAPTVYAAGDIANAVHPLFGQRLRSEHWANAIDGGTTAAAAMLGRPVEHDAVPYFYTDQFEIGMEYAGFAPLTRGAETVYRGDPASGEFIVFWWRDGRVVAGMNVNVWEVNDDIKALVASGRRVSPEELRDVDLPLASLAESSDAGDASRRAAS